MFLGTTYQNGKNIPNDHKKYQMAIKCNKNENVPKIKQIPSEMYQNCDF
jgi:hypothetical protein